MAKKKTNKIECSCIDCNKHSIISDRDPDDWFCDDDIAVVCSLVKNPSRDLESKYLSDHSKFKSITVGCRPYNVRRKAKIPRWCPKE